MTARPLLHGPVSPWMGRLLAHSPRLDLELDDGAVETLLQVVVDPRMLEPLRTGQPCRMALMSTERPDVSSGEQAPLYFVLAVQSADSSEAVVLNERVRSLSAVLAPAATATLLGGIALSVALGHAAWFAAAVLAFVAMRYVWAQLPRTQVIDSAAAGLCAS